MTGNAQQRIWFYYANEQQVGPITISELSGAIGEKLLGPSDYIYREGFSDWKALKDVPEVFSLAEKNNSSTVQNATQKRSMVRAPIQELVVAHNDASVATGVISNISTTGVFFETSSSAFSLNDEVKLTLKEGKGLGKPMHLQGVVVRQIRDTKAKHGYGLELVGLDERSRARIEEYILRNQAS